MNLRQKLRVLCLHKVRVIINLDINVNINIHHDYDNVITVANLKSERAQNLPKQKSQDLFKTKTLSIAKIEEEETKYKDDTFNNKSSKIY
jgi:hypothetical protein